MPCPPHPVQFVSAMGGQVSLVFMGIPPTIEYASLSMADSLILMVLALVVFGPRRLPQIGRQIGKLMYEFRKASNDFKYQMEEELRSAEDADRKKKEEERLSTLALAAPAEVTETPGTTAGASVESPYPGEDQYPAAIGPETPPQEAYPSIQPPSTGEQVPAARPAIQVAQVVDETSPTAVVEGGIDSDSGADAASGSAREVLPVEETVSLTEQAAHHG
jgi:sec-independent protein translocase protein TatB